jgi:DNA-binding transcriptional MerR regulator
MKNSYTKKEVAEITGLPYRNVQFYTEQGVVVPEVEEAGGRGKFRRYSNRNLVSFIIAGELASYGMTVGEMRKIVLTIRQFWEVPNVQEKIKDEKILSFFSSMLVQLQIGKTKDKTKIFELRLGVDNKGEPLIKFSIVTTTAGKSILNVKSPDEKLNFTMDEKRRIIKNFDLHKLIKEELVSYIYIRVDELIKEAIKRTA